MNVIVPISSFLAIISALLLLIINPGIIYSDNKSKKKEKIYCSYCKFLYPINKKLEHCDECGVCICNYDHHCGVIGKCVGKYNKILFCLFVLSISGFILSFYLILLNLIFFKEGE